MAQVFEMCSSANYLLRMPGWIDVPAFPDPDRNESVFDTPVVVRKHRRPRDEVRAELGLDPKDKVVLISFGGHQLAKDSWEAGNFLPPGWVGLVCGPGKRIQTDGGSDGARLVSIPMESAYIPDITNASDVVLGKLGYGTCCECLDAKVPFVYVSRPGFIEEPGLLRLMLDCNPQGSVTEMPHADFREGNWASYLMEVVDKKHNPPRVPMDSNGDEWIADWVVSFLENGRPKPKTMS